MGVLHFVLDFLTGAGFWLGALAFVHLLVRLVRVVRGRRTLHRAVLPAPLAWLPEPHSWWLTLLVEVDNETRLLPPSVQLRGGALPFPARLRLDIVDEYGRVRLSSRRSLPPSAIGTELALTLFATPDGADVEDVLRWHWDVVIEDWRGERARWREHPAPAGALNAEAELELPGVAGI